MGSEKWEAGTRSGKWKTLKSHFSPHPPAGDQLHPSIFSIQIANSVLRICLYYD